MKAPRAQLIQADARAIPLADQSVQLVVTSPPYWGLRDYGHEGQIGLEETPEQYVETMVAVFREVWRVLREDGTVWVNLGDTYSSAGGSGEQGQSGQRRDRRFTADGSIKPKMPRKHKDIIGIPWLVALALQRDGWYLRQDIIWAKPNAMPESVRDRCWKTHEYVFLLSKAPRYYYNAEAVAEPSAKSSVARLSQPTLHEQAGSDRVPGKTNGNMKAVGGETRKPRSVWWIATKPYKGAHFATFPPELPRRCIRAGSREGDVILDPFVGSGTTCAVALEQGRSSVGLDSHAEYLELADHRIRESTEAASLFLGSAT